MCNRCDEDQCSCWLDPPDDADKNEGFEPSKNPKVG